MTEFSGVSGLTSMETELARQSIAQATLGSMARPQPQLPENSANEVDTTPLTHEEEQGLNGAVEKLDQVIKPLSIGLNIQRIESLNRFYVELFDRETGEVIREIPARQIIQMQEHVRQIQGLMFDKFS
jgi:flagellar protein FlaG